MHLVVGPGYTFDLKNFAWPPRIASGERPYVYEQVVYANHAPDGKLYVETAHQTYAKSSFGLNGYLNAIDPKRGKLLWRSPARVANAYNFVLLNDTVVTGTLHRQPDFCTRHRARPGRSRAARAAAEPAIRTPPRHGTDGRHLRYRVVVKVTGA
jgi:hypothetical protein